MSEAIKTDIDRRMVSLTIDGQLVSVPEGTLVVDAAKMVDIDIPVFCYHPKMDPVGMCRMCLVEVGRPVRDRASGEIELAADGSPKLQFGPKMETGCTVEVMEGMVVRGTTEAVSNARREVLELLLTSHPLDCPICDKGGECPLQNLTMDFGPGTSRYLYDEKIHFPKHVPLGELIYLDRERCIQCARCTRFQDEIAGDAVIGFSQRGRSLEIVTFSEPGFDSYWSGNTSDICPVGALTTADFRFGARPWELNSSASICNHCPVGCNLTLNTRREAKTSGEMVVKRVMPRQNEAVNEIWICDKGRFGYHYSEKTNRITQPMVRKDGELVAVSWEEALDAAAKGLLAAGTEAMILAGRRLSNEDYFQLKQFSEHLNVASVLDSCMAGGDLVAQVGVGEGTNFSDMGPETAILVVASDLEEEAPLWWLRVKQAADRGAAVISANARRTKLDRSATYTLRYDYGEEAALVESLAASLSPKKPSLSAAAKKLLRLDSLKEAAEAFFQAENAVILFGSEGAGYAQSMALARVCANLLVLTGHSGRANNGLIGVWDGGNVQGAWDMGLRPSEDLEAAIKGTHAIYIIGADPAGDDLRFQQGLKRGDTFVVVQDVQMSPTAELADVVLPVQAFIEREGTYTSGERRVQRFYPAVPEPEGVKADFSVTAELAIRAGLELEKRIASRTFLRIAQKISDYADLDYQKLAEVDLQLPIIGRSDVYYGGTSYQNSQGLGVQLAPAAQRGELTSLSAPTSDINLPKAKLLAVPITRLYDRGSTLLPSKVLSARLAQPHVVLHPDMGEKLGLEWGSTAKAKINGATKTVSVEYDNSIPKNAVLVPRSLGIPIASPTAITLEAK